MLVQTCSQVLCPNSHAQIYVVHGYCDCLVFVTNLLSTMSETAGGKKKGKKEHDTAAYQASKSCKIILMVMLHSTYYSSTQSLPKPPRI